MEEKKPLLNEDELVEVSGGWYVGFPCPDCKTQLVQGPYGIKYPNCSWYETL